MGRVFEAHHLDSECLWAAPADLASLDPPYRIRADTLQPFAYPLITPIGRIRATFRDRSGLVDDVDHVIDVLVRLRLLLREALAALRPWR